MAAGHVHAFRYPLGRLSVEAELVRQRMRDETADQMVYDQAVLASVMGSGKKAHRAFAETVKGLRK